MIRVILDDVTYRHQNDYRQHEVHNLDHPNESLVETKCF